MLGELGSCEHGAVRLVEGAPRRILPAELSMMNSEAFEDSIPNQTTPQKIRAPRGKLRSPRGGSRSVQAVKGKSSRLSLRSPGNAKPDIDARTRRNTVKAIRRRSVTPNVKERPAPQHSEN